MVKEMHPIRPWDTSILHLMRQASYLKSINVCQKKISQGELAADLAAVTKHITVVLKMATKGMAKRTIADATEPDLFCAHANKRRLSNDNQNVMLCTCMAGQKIFPLQVQ